MGLFRKLCVNLRVDFCGVQDGASPQAAHFMPLSETPHFSIANCAVPIPHFGMGTPEGIELSIARWSKTRLR